MKPSLYLHIGRPKTGSTALQHFLMKNRKALLEQDILYPITGNYQLSSHLFAYAYSEQMRKDARLPDIDAPALWGKLGVEFAAAGVSSVILSSENFWFSDPSELKADIGEDFSVKVIAYIRRQDHVIASSFCEEVKREHISLNEDVERYALFEPRLKLLDYFKILESWGNSFGPENVDVRIYESLDQGGIALDLCKQLDLQVDRLSLDRNAINPALPYDLLTLIGNVGGFKAGDAAKRRFVTAVSESFAMLDSDPAYNTAGLFSLELRRQILDRFSDSNEAILSTFLGQKAAALFPSLDDENYSRPSEEFDLQRISKLLLGMHAHQEKVNTRLIRRLGKLERELDEQRELLAQVLKTKL